MRLDILLPKNNEEQLLATAEKLGFNQIILLYDVANPKFKEKIFGKLKVFTAGIIKTSSEIQKFKKNHDFVFAPAQRQFFEDKYVTHIINAEFDEKKDSLHQRKSGLDDIMCVLAEKTKKTIVFNITLLSNKKTFGRMTQNTKLCRKHKLNTLFVTLASKPSLLRAPKDLNGFARVLSL